MRLNTGFTVIELLVSMAIFGILATMVVANFEQGRRRDELTQSAERLASLFRQAQSYAISGRIVGTSMPVGGYGVKIDINEQNDGAIFFAERGSKSNKSVKSVKIADGLYNNNDDTADGLYNNNDDTIEKLVLPTNVKIESIKIFNSEQNLSSPSRIDFTARAPFGTRYLYKNGDTNGRSLAPLFKITLQHSLSQKVAEVIVYVSSGLVQVNLLP